MRLFILLHENSHIVKLRPLKWMVGFRFKGWFNLTRFSLTFSLKLTIICDFSIARNTEARADCHGGFIRVSADVAWTKIIAL